MCTHAHMHVHTHISTHKIETARWEKAWVFKEGENQWWRNETRDRQAEVEGSWSWVWLPCSLFWAEWILEQGVGMVCLHFCRISQATRWKWGRSEVERKLGASLREVLGPVQPSKHHGGLGRCGWIWDRPGSRVDRIYWVIACRFGEGGYWRMWKRNRRSPGFMYKGPEG